MNSHRVLPVIHVESEGQAMANARLAFDAGADGVFLINYGGLKGGVRGLLALAIEVKHQCGKWVGANFLGLHPHDAMRLPMITDIDGLWTDNADIDENKGIDEQMYPDYVRLLKKENCPKLEYFGGTAFKYQRKVKELERAAQIASEYMDYICTSGPGTGEAADVSKIARIAAKATKPVAIASGINPDNVTDYLEFASAFLVATGISKNFITLDAMLTSKLIETVRAYKAPLRS